MRLGSLRSSLFRLYMTFYQHEKRHDRNVSHSIRIVGEIMLAKPDADIDILVIYNSLFSIVCLHDVHLIPTGFPSSWLRLRETKLQLSRSATRLCEISAQAPSPLCTISCAVQVSDRPISFSSASIPENIIQSMPDIKAA